MKQHVYGFEWELITCRHVIKWSKNEVRKRKRLLRRRFRRSGKEELKALWLSG